MPGLNWEFSGDGADPVLASGILIKAVHLTDLRAALDPARAAIGLPAISYNQPTIVAGATTVRAVDVVEIRNAVK